MICLIVCDFELNFFRTSTKIFQQVSGNCILRFLVNSLSKIFVQNKFQNISKHLVSSLKEFWTFDKKLSAKLSKVSFMCPEERLRIFCGKVTLLFVSLGIWAKNYPIFAGSFSAGLWKLHLTSPEECFEYLFEKSYISFHYFWTLTVKNYPTFGKKLGKFVKKVFWAFRGTYCEKKQLFWKKTYALPDRLWTSSQNLPELSQKCISTFFKTALYGSREELEQN